MIRFIETIGSQPILMYAIIAGILASVVAGVIGTFISLKNISYVSGGIAHAILGGIGIAYFAGTDEYIGAIIFALAAAVIISLVHQYQKENENVIIGALWAVGMAVGIVFMYLTPGYSVDLSTYIFGSIILLSKHDLILIAILTGIISVSAFIFYRQFIAISFDTEHARLKGLNITLIYMLLLSLISLSVVILVKITGLIMLIALFTLPAAIARMWISRIFSIMVFAFILCFLAMFSGFYASYSLELPAGSMIVLIIGGIYFVSLLTRLIRSKVS